MSDADDWRVACAGSLLHRCAGRRRSGEHQFIVIATCQAVFVAKLASGDCQYWVGSYVAQQVISVQHGPHAAGGEDVAQVAQQAVAHIGGGVGNPAQGHAQRHTRRRALHAQAGCRKGFGAHQGAHTGCAPEHFQRQACVAQATAHINVVAHLCGTAAQGLVFRHLAEHGDANVQRPRRGVSPHQCATMDVGQGQQPFGKCRQPGVVGTRQRQSQREGQWLGTHGGQVAQVHGQCLVAQRLGADGGQKVAAFHQHVGGHGQPHAGCGGQQGAIVAVVQRHSRWVQRVLKVAADQVKFTHACAPHCLGTVGASSPSSGASDGGVAPSGGGRKKLSGAWRMRPRMAAAMRWRFTSLMACAFSANRKAR